MHEMLKHVCINITQKVVCYITSRRFLFSRPRRYTPPVLAARLVLYNPYPSPELSTLSHDPNSGDLHTPANSEIPLPTLPYGRKPRRPSGGEWLRPPHPP